MRLLGVTEETVANSYTWAHDLLAKVQFTQNPFMPSFWITEGLVRSARGDWHEALFMLGLVAGNGLMATQVAVWVSRWLYPIGWSRVAGGGEKRRYPGRRWLGLSDKRIVMRLLLDKDFTVFRRDPVQWSQCAILFGLLAIYILNLRAFPFQTQKLIWRSWTSFLNLTATSLVLATLTTRFIFPLLSLEGKRFWILSLLPIRRETILYGKFWFSFVISVAVSEVLTVLSNVMLETSWEIRILHVCTVALICAALSGMSVGLGAVYPNLKEDNPSKIVSGFGGTLNLILSLIYVVLVVAIEAVPCHLYLSQHIGLPEMKVWAVVGIAFILILTAVATVLPMRLGLRALRRMEV
jgi:ABC-2 type transport system permease protein